MLKYLLTLVTILVLSLPAYAQETFDLHITNDQIHSQGWDLSFQRVELHETK